MNYQNTRKLAINRIDFLNSKGISKLQIIYSITKEFEFSRKFCEERLKFLEELEQEMAENEPKKHKKREKNLKNDKKRN